MNKKKALENTAVIPDTEPARFAFGLLRIMDGKVSLDKSICNKGIKGIDLENTGAIVVTLQEQPSGRPLILCPTGFVVPGEEYNEFRIMPDNTLELGKSVSFLAIYK